MKYIRRYKWLYGAFFILSAFLIILPFILEHQIAYQIESRINRKVLLDDVDLNLFTLELRLEKFAIKESISDKNFISFDDFYINASWLSLFRFAIVIDQIELKQPFFQGVMFSDKKFNFSDITASKHTSLEKIEENSKKKTPKSDKVNFSQLPVSFDIKRIKIHNGNVLFNDKVNDQTHRLKGFNFHIPHITNLSELSDNSTEITLNFSINETKVNIQTQADLFQKEPLINILFENSGGDLSFYQPYINKYIDWKISSGELITNISTEIKLINNEPDINVYGNIKIVNFDLKKNQQTPLMSFPLFEVKIDRSNLIKPDIKLSHVKLINPKIQLIKYKDLSLNWVPKLKHLQNKKGEKNKKKENTSNLTTTKKISKPKQTKAIALQIDKIQLKNGEIGFKDFSLAKSFETQLKNLNIAINSINMKEQKIKTIEFQTQLLPHGKVYLKGTADLDPLKWGGYISIKDLDISIAQPYINEYLNGSLESGRLFIDLKTLFEQKKKNPQVQLSGNIALNHFVYREPMSKEEVLSWDKFEILKINQGIFPNYLDIDEVRLESFKAPVFLLPDGKLNWMAITKNENDNNKAKNNIVKAEASKITQVNASDNKSLKNKSSEKPLKPFKRFKIRKIIMENSNIRFVDQTMSPPFQAKMTQLSGQVLGIDQEESSSANFVLNGKLNDSSPLKIVGRISPFKNPLSLNVEVLFQGIDVPLFTSYTDHYIGYPLDKGQLSLNLNYQLDQNELNSKNKVLLDQLELGEKSENAEIPSLPLEFALALLKDREGKINIDIPINGKLDSLNFSLKKTILQTLKNMMEKVITSPFSFLTQLFDGKEDIQSLIFEFGITELNQSVLLKIDQIAKLLEKRPLLKLQLLSHLHKYKEIKALRIKRLKKELELLKFKEKTTLSEANEKLKHIVLNEEEYKKYLIKLYKIRFNKMPAFKYQNRRSLEPTLASTIKVAQEDLHALSLKRMVNIRNILVDKYKIEPERIFISESIAKDDSLPDKSQSQIIIKLK